MYRPTDSYCRMGDEIPLLWIGKIRPKIQGKKIENNEILFSNFVVKMYQFRENGILYIEYKLGNLRKIRMIDLWSQWFLRWYGKCI